MAIDLNEYNRLKKIVDEKTAESQRAAGALEQTLTRLRNEFGCKTAEEARTKLRQLEQEEKKAQEEAEAAYEQFKKDYADVFPA